MPIKQSGYFSYRLDSYLILNQGILVTGNLLDYPLNCKSLTFPEFKLGTTKVSFLNYSFDISTRSNITEKKLVIQAKKYKGESSVISARIPIELVKTIDGIAEKSGKTRNEIIMACLEFAVENIVIESEEK